MELMEAIMTRRSVRKYRNEPIPEQMITETIKAAMYAPSAGNEQPWHFIVITDEALLKKVPDINEYAAMAAEAPAAILVCADLALEKYPGNWVLDCAAAIQNLLLAAHAKGLGAVWTGIYPNLKRMRSFSELLALPDNIIPHALIVMGYPDQEIAQPDRFKADRIHYNGLKT